MEKQSQEARVIDQILEARGLSVSDFTSYHALPRTKKALILVRAATEELNASAIQ